MRENNVNFFAREDAAYKSFPATKHTQFVQLENIWLIPSEPTAN